MAASSARAFAAFDAATLPMAIMLLNRDTLGAAIPTSEGVTGVTCPSEPS
eukprot:CAMPEP_0173115446 /NCGR_PEP_ID=MMETSP1102-20130122/48482_1 /TAXON_ID=49646 /ORGANISM="Geminigera sp., Strain Caron Lab Isolate" /LENGTH=49 /DNA_ID= /DNA_START= /DNA_END= /DNA_ORIENTATION=